MRDPGNPVQGSGSVQESVFKARAGEGKASRLAATGRRISTVQCPIGRKAEYDFARRFISQAGAVGVVRVTPAF
jgi:hypothetical protein